MSLLRKMLSGDTGADEARRFLVEAMLAAIGREGTPVSEPTSCLASGRS